MENSEYIVSAFRSERLVYRAYEDDEDDKMFIHEYLENDPANTIMGSPHLPRPKPFKSAQQYIDFQTKALISVLVCLAPEKKDAQENTTSGTNRDGKPNKKPRPTPIGMVSLFNVHGGEAVHRNSMVGIAIASPYKGKGYGGEAINWVLDWGFRKAGLHRICLSTWSFNTRAIALYKKLGFVEEGRERQAISCDRKWYDVVNFGMLEHEWEELRGLSTD